MKNSLVLLLIAISIFANLCSCSKSPIIDEPTENLNVNPMEFIGAEHNRILDDVFAGGGFSDIHSLVDKLNQSASLTTLPINYNDICATELDDILTEIERADYDIIRYLNSRISLESLEIIREYLEDVKKTSSIHEVVSLTIDFDKMTNCSALNQEDKNVLFAFSSVFVNSLKFWSEGFEEKTDIHTDRRKCRWYHWICISVFDAAGAAGFVLLGPEAAILAAGGISAVAACCGWCGCTACGDINCS